MSIEEGPTDNSSSEPLRRWMAMSELVERIDHFDRLLFLDAVASEWVTRFSGIHDIDLWQQVPTLDDPILSEFLDGVAIVLDELTNNQHETIIESGVIQSSQMIRDPHMTPSWWPFDLTREEKEWVARIKRSDLAMLVLTSEEEAEIYANALHELRCTHSWAPTVRSFLERGELFRDTVHFLIPALEAELEQRGYLSPPRKGLR